MASQYLDKAEITWGNRPEFGPLVEWLSGVYFPAITLCMGNCTPAWSWFMPKLGVFSSSVGLLHLMAGLQTEGALEGKSLPGKWIFPVLLNAHLSSHGIAPQTLLIQQVYSSWDQQMGWVGLKLLQHTLFLWKLYCHALILVIIWNFYFFKNVAHFTNWMYNPNT